jgi:hypothetical protein
VDLVDQAAEVVDLVVIVPVPAALVARPVELLPKAEILKAVPVVVPN